MSFARVRGPGHPDRTCDLVAASVVQEYLRRDPESRLYISVTGGQGVLFVAGDVSSQADFDVSSVVTRALWAAGVTQHLEPFIAFEPMQKKWAVARGAREPIFVNGYATNETEECLPRVAALARRIACRLERMRAGDPDGFWLGADYEASVLMHSTKPLATIRAEHVDTRTLADVREQLTALVHEVDEQIEARINPSGEEISAGIASRMGVSGHASAVDGCGANIPTSVSGTGRHLSHPLNAGAYIARAVARELACEHHGRAVMVQTVWLPLEAKPFFLRIRNERGEDLAPRVDQSRFDLANIPSDWLDPALATDAIRWHYDSSVRVPWEDGS